jgi:hypothetical protein
MLFSDTRNLNFAYSGHVILRSLLYWPCSQSYLLSNTHADTFERFALKCNLRTFAILSVVHTAQTYKKGHSVTPSPAFIQMGCK